MGNPLFFVQRKTGCLTASILKMVSAWLLLSASGYARLNDQQRLIIDRGTPSVANNALPFPKVI
jgi:hypothetical protein